MITSLKELFENIEHHIIPLCSTIKSEMYYSTEDFLECINAWDYNGEYEIDLNEFNVHFFQKDGRTNCVFIRYTGYSAPLFFCLVIKGEHLMYESHHNGKNEIYIRSILSCDFYEAK